MNIGINYKYRDDFQDYCKNFIEKNNIKNLEIYWYKHDCLDKEYEEEYLKQILFLKNTYNIKFSLHFPTSYDFGTRVPFFRYIIKEHIKECLVFANSLDIDLIVIHPGTIGQMDIPKNNRFASQRLLLDIAQNKKAKVYELSLEIFDFIKSEIEKNNYKLKIAIENLVLDNEICIKSKDLIALLKKINSDAFGICLNYAHAHRSGQDLIEYTHEVKDFLIHIHISDNDGKCDLHSFPEADGCNLPWDDIFNVLREIEYDKLIIAELNSENLEIFNFTVNFLKINK
ncbi:sugar phosphate isomerase/epimerase family protein [Cetobacterium sp.]|uniref:sugar phosphate isomerase/epimerase family protein n=1 Tax=Cetobacterium sp. TaxID=2071632 RepID=UPI003F40BADC